VPTGGPVQLSAAPFIYPHRRRIDYLFVQDEWRLHPDWTMTSGLRHDRYSDAGSSTNPRLALVWDAAVNWTAKLLYGEAFRAPTFSELYATNNPIARGNPALRPETTRTLEMVLAWSPRTDLQANLNLFSYRMHDIIRTLPNPPPTPGTSYTNLGSQQGRGLEAEVVWDPLRQLRISGQFSYQRSVDPATGLDVGYVPRRHAVLVADVNPQHLDKILLKTYERSPEDFETLLGMEGVGARTLRALALASEIIYGTPASMRDPARFSFAVGGKDGFPYPVDLETYDKTVEVLRAAVNKANIDRSERVQALKRLVAYGKEKIASRQN
jgi:hypothetical protein